MKLQALAAKKSVHLLFGTLLYDQNEWYHAGIYLSPGGAMHIYKKVNLAWHERGILKPGSKLECFSIETNTGSFLASIQLCREIRFPEQWTALADDGSQIFFYLTNTINADAKAVWDAHLISRAAENQRFVLSSNVAHHDQGCSTLAIDPEENVLHAIPSADEAMIKVQFDLSQNSSWYLNQRRTDLMDCRLR
ncbi:carbon-nitrogen hydrolase family protein [Metabacillus sp. KIGAM252]|uniref:Carbon-nitrogen hydrolase family protein n=1 Tax=Metabacillus flavus TaxID=2823519 RepID=A0ABS5LJP4_9BACI|nr:carbon-nitrogen hydrolase family protein [Metabacillus flavus]